MPAANNTLITPTAVTREALRILHQKLNFIGTINRGYDKQYAKEGAKIGQNLNIRLPNQYVIRRGQQLAAQSTVEATTPLAITNQVGVDLNFSSTDLTLALDDFSDRIIDPAMAVLAANIEADVMSISLQFHLHVNNQGVAATLNQLLNGKKILTDQLTPLPKRTANMNTQDMIDLVKDTKTLFNPDNAISDQYKDGAVGHAATFDFYENTLWPSFTPGTHAGYTVNGAGQTGSALAVNAGNGTMNVGDVFTIAGVYRVHPETKAQLQELHQFVVTAAYAGGAGNVAFQPAIVVTGAKQNVSASPAANAAVTFAGTAGTPHGISMLYHKDAFAFATADLVMPDGVDWKAREVQDGLSIRIVRQYDINNDAFPCRLDMIYGYAAIRAQLAARYACN